MNVVINELLEELEANLNTQKQDELFQQIAFILERSSYHTTGSESLYNTFLSAEMLLLRLNTNEQKIVLKTLSNTLPKLNKVHHYQLLWVLGKASPAAGLEVLLTIFVKYYSEFDNNAQYHALIALDNFLVYNLNGTLKLPIKNLIKNNDPKPFLQAASNHADTRIKELASSISQRID